MILATISRIMKLPAEVPNPWQTRYFLCDHFRKVFDELKIPLASIVNTQGLDELCDVCDGLVILGSAQGVPPIYYGREPIESVKYKIDEFKEDRVIIDKFVAKNKPIFGICGGIQTLNVYFGGTLKQHIDGHENTSHQIKVEKDSFLYRVKGKEIIEVNSLHRQAVDDVAPGFKVTAVAEDGTIEAIEKDNIVAFQWHPEIMHDVELFKAFIKEYF